MDYLDFELEIAPESNGRYPVKVLTSPAGEFSGSMQLPFDRETLEGRLRNVQAVLLRSAPVRRGAAAAASDPADSDVSVRELGGQLFGALFEGTLLANLNASQNQAEESHRGLRIKLRVEAPELALLPWEFLYDATRSDYLTLAASTPLVRYVPAEAPPDPLKMTRPLRILGVVASPAGLKPLNVERERQRLELAVDALRGSGDIELVWLGGQTPRYLQAALRHGPWHVLHFIGHGGFDRDEGQGFLILANDKGGPRVLYARDLAHLVDDHQEMRLVVLNACDGARGSEADLFSSSASFLVRQGTPAVVAMQFEITDEAAIEFSRSFYEALADGVAIDTALGEARKSMSIALQGSLEWGTPVLYTHAEDGVLFNVGRPRRRPHAKVAASEEAGKVAVVFDAADADAASALAAALATGPGIETTLVPVAAGAPSVAGADDALDDALASVVMLGPANRSAWDDPVIRRILTRRSHDREFGIVPVLLPGSALPDLGRLPEFLAGQEWIDLRDDLDSPERLVALVDALSIGAGSGTPSERPAATSKDPPFRGLQVFEEEHAADFFGREALTQQLVERVRGDRFLAVVGPSGSGKSSVVRAGLIPQLRRGIIGGSATWPIVLLKPGSHPLEALAAKLAPLTGIEGDLEATGDAILTALLHDERGLHSTVETALAGRDSAERIVLVVDQFEEAFTLCQDPSERERFASVLLEAAGVAEGRTIVVLTMRSDFMSRAAALPALAAMLAEHDVLVTPMTREELRRAIVEPARRAGLRFEQGLVDTIMAEIGGEVGALPLLEDTLLALWEGRTGGWLTMERYREIGGVRGALAQRAQDLYDSLPEAQQLIARRVLLALVEFGSGVEVTRRRANLSDLSAPGGAMEPAVLDAVIQKLVEARLVTTDQGEAGVVVDVAHEALINNWPTFQGWIEEDGAGLRLHRRLADEAAQWEAGARDPSYLRSGRRLVEATTWAHETLDDLHDVRDFIDASTAAEAAERQARLDAEAEVERARLAAEAEKRSARERQQRIVTRLGAVIVVVALVGGGLALWSAVQANDARAAAEHARLIADAQAKAAHGVTTSATAPLPGLGEALDGLALAEQAGIATGDYRDGVQDLIGSGRIAALGADVERLILSPDGMYVVVDIASAPGTIVRMEDGARIATLAGQVSDVAFGPVGARVFGVHYLDAPGELRLWETGAAITLTTPDPEFNFPRDPDARVVVIGYRVAQLEVGEPTNSTEPIEVRSLEDGAVLRSLDRATNALVVAGPDEDRALVHFDDRHLEILRLTDGVTVGSVDDAGNIKLPAWGPPTIFAVQHEQPEPESVACTIHRLADGALISKHPREATFDAINDLCGVMGVSDDGSIASVSRARTDAVIEVADPGAQPLSSTSANLILVAFAPGEKPAGFLAFGHGGVDVWRLGDQEPIRRLDGRPDNIAFSGPKVEFSPDGGFATFRLDKRVVLLRMATGESFMMPEGSVNPDEPPITVQRIEFGIGQNGVLAHLIVTSGVDGDTWLMTDPPVHGPFGRVAFWPGDPGGPAITYAFNDWGPALGIRTVAMDNFQAVDFGPGPIPTVAVVAFPRSSEDGANGGPSTPSVVVFQDGTVVTLRSGAVSSDFSTEPGTSTIVFRFDDERSEVWDSVAHRTIGILGLGVGENLFDAAGRRLAVRYLNGDAYLVDLERLRTLPDDLDDLSEQDLVNLACKMLGDRASDLAPTACR